MQIPVLVIDNYDSFTFNLVHYLEAEGAHCTVVRNDECSLEQVSQYDRIVLSPGPGLPSEAGITPKVLQHLRQDQHVLGVCLGLQAIVEWAGGTLLNLKEVIHGRSTHVHVSAPSLLFQGLPNSFATGRYHSWVADPQHLPTSLIVTAQDNHGNIMALKHRDRPIEAVQFHPESVMTPTGRQMIHNWLQSTL